MSMYAEYLKERENKEVLEAEGALCVYQIFSDFVYIVDIYVKPEFRKSGHAKDIADQVCKKAKAIGAKYLVGTVDASTLGATDSLKVLLAYGMRLDSVQGNVIYFKKDL